MLVFVNGCFIGRNDHGYVHFRFDVTDFLSYGAKNCITATRGRELWRWMVL